MATKKPFILLEGTPLQKKVYLENPQEPTADDLKLIQRLYGLPQGLDLKQTVDALNQLKDLGEVPSIAQAPSLDSPEKFAKEASQLEEIDIAAAKDDLLLSLLRAKKLVLINNPNEDENKEWAEIRERSRCRLIRMLERSKCSQTYNPGTCEEILDRISKYFDQTLENTIAEIKRQMAEKSKKNGVRTHRNGGAAQRKASTGRGHH